MSVVPSGVKLFVTFAVMIGVYVSVASVSRFGRFLADDGGDCSPSRLRLPPLDPGLFFRITVNLTLASCFLYSPSFVKRVVQETGYSYGLSNCYYKFIKTVLLSFVLNGVILLWQAVPEICLWRLQDTSPADAVHFYLHRSMWIVLLMIVVAIDIAEITGLNSIFHRHLTNNRPFGSLKSRQYNRLLENMSIPGASCIIIALWAQKVMSFDRFLLAMIWTSGILSSSQTDSKDIEYVAREIVRKKSWMYFTEEMTMSPLN